MKFDQKVWQQSECNWQFFCPSNLEMTVIGRREHYFCGKLKWVIRWRKNFCRPMFLQCNFLLSNGPHFVCPEWGEINFEMHHSMFAQPLAREALNIRVYLSRNRARENIFWIQHASCCLHPPPPFVWSVISLFLLLSSDLHYSSLGTFIFHYRSLLTFLPKTCWCSWVLISSTAGEVAQ